MEGWDWGKFAGCAKYSDSRISILKCRILPHTSRVFIDKIDQPTLLLATLFAWLAMKQRKRGDLGKGKVRLDLLLHQRALLCRSCSWSFESS